MKTLNERARAYANRNFAIQVGEIPSIKVDISDHLKRAYIAGAKDALHSQWRSVDDEMPEADDDVLVVYSHSYTPAYIEMAVAYYDGEDWYTQDGSHIRPSHWMNIPEPPKSK